MISVHEVIGKAGTQSPAAPGALQAAAPFPVSNMLFPKAYPQVCEPRALPPPR